MKTKNKKKEGEKRERKTREMPKWKVTISIRLKTGGLKLVAIEIISIEMV
jgi:hypothetical protein